MFAHHLAHSSASYTEFTYNVPYLRGKTAPTHTYKVARPNQINYKTIPAGWAPDDNTSPLYEVDTIPRGMPPYT